MSAASTYLPHWSVRLVAVAGLPFGLLLVAFNAFIVFALVFNGHPAMFGSGIYFVVSTLLVIADIGLALAVLAGKRGAFSPLLIVTGAEVAAACGCIAAALVSGPLEQGQLMQWICFLPIPLRFAVLFVASRRASSVHRE